MNARSLAPLFLAASGWPTGNLTRNVHGTQSGYSLANAKPKPMSLMVAARSSAPSTSSSTPTA